MKNPNKLNILWTTDNADTAIRMIMMYSKNAIKNAWWENVDVIIWGGAAELAGKNEDVQAEIAACTRGGVNFIACKACADQLGVSDKLLEMGVDVRFMGQPLTEILKDGEPFLSV